MKIKINFHKYQKPFELKMFLYLEKWVCVSGSLFIKKSTLCTVWINTMYDFRAITNSYRKKWLDIFDGCGMQYSQVISMDVSPFFLVLRSVASFCS